MTSPHLERIPMTQRKSVNHFHHDIKKSSFKHEGRYESVYEE